MQYHVTNYGVFTTLCPQVFALPEDASLDQGALNVVNKAVFTLGVNGQANTVKGVQDGKRYASNLKWAYTTFPSSDADFFQSNTLADGCSQGDTDADLAWSNLNTVFIDDNDMAAIWSYGKLSASTGAQSPRLNISCTMHNGTTAVLATYQGRITFNTYTIMQTALAFKYMRNTANTIDAGSYGYRRIDGQSDMIMFCDSVLPNQVKTVAKYECVRSGMLFRFTPDELDFGQLVAGTRPKIQKFLTAAFDL